METSIKSAKRLTIIGAVQFLPYTAMAIFGLGFIYPLVLWTLGTTLFVFYIKHGRDKISKRSTIKNFWIASLIYNGFGLLVPVSAIILAGRTIFAAFTDPSDWLYHTGDDWVGVFFLLALSISPIIHFWLSYKSFIGLKEDSADRTDRFNMPIFVSE